MAWDSCMGTVRKGALIRSTERALSNLRPLLGQKIEVLKERWLRTHRSLGTGKKRVTKMEVKEIEGLVNTKKGRDPRLVRKDLQAGGNTEIGILKGRRDGVCVAGGGVGGGVTTVSWRIQSSLWLINHSKFI